MKRLFLIFCLIFLLQDITYAFRRNLIREYEPYFKKYSKQFFGLEVDYRWFLAQGIAESGLNPRAISSAGALGILQLMPFTAKELNVSEAEIFDPRVNIRAGIQYDRKLYAQWGKCPEKQERLYLTFASYNAGLGHIKKAYSKVLICDWNLVKVQLVMVTGYHAQETTNYIHHIQLYFIRLTNHAKYY